VYQAADSRLGRNVALKLLPQAFTHDLERVARFRREARVLASLNHPNIAAIHGLEEAEGRNFLVMELAEGETLAQRIRRSAIPVEEALEIAVQIAEGLEAAHERGIVHRDLKPANVKITPGGRVKVLDFGLAKVFESERVKPSSPESTTISSARTQEGAIFGTTPYMSPEQVEGKALDARSDIFSLGVVMYEMFCGTRPFHGETIVATFASILREAPKRPREIRHEIPVEIDRIVMRCLEKDPGLRYSSARELHSDLKAQAELKTGNRRPLLRRAAAVAVTLVLVSAAGVFGARAYVDYSRGRWAENEALPQFRKFMEQSEPLAAF
jgi:serine/threonine protein kinase